MDGTGLVQCAWNEAIEKKNAANEAALVGNDIKLGLHLRVRWIVTKKKKTFLMIA